MKIAIEKSKVFFGFFILFSSIAFQGCGKDLSPVQDLENTKAYSAPTITITKTPENLINVREATFEFNIDDDKLNYEKISECYLDNVKLENCKSPLVLSGLSDGVHVLMVKVLGLQEKENKAFFDWTVDATAPTFMITAPTSVTGSPNQSVSFIVTEDVSGIESIQCSFQNGAFADCVSPLVYEGQTEATYNLKIMAKDKAGNSSEEALVSWAVDLSAPVLNFIKTPDNPSKLATATFELSALDAGVALTNLECQLDGGGYLPCTSPKTYVDLTEENHSFDFRAKDQVGNLSQPKSFPWMVDLTAPAVTIMTGPENPTKENTATFTFSVTDNNGSGVDKTECRIDDNAFQACASPQAFQDIADGNHKFELRSQDKAGNLSAVKDFSWVSDATPPVVVIVSKPSNPSFDSSAIFTWQASDPGSGVKKVECRIDAQNFANCESLMTFTDLTHGPHVFEIRAEDNLGNVSAIEKFNWQAQLTKVITGARTDSVNMKSARQIFGSYLNLTGVQESACKSAFENEKATLPRDGDATKFNDKAQTAALRLAACPCIQVSQGNGFRNTLFKDINFGGGTAVNFSNQALRALQINHLLDSLWGTSLSSHPDKTASIAALDGLIVKMIEDLPNSTSSTREVAAAICSVTLSSLTVVTK